MTNSNIPSFVDLFVYEVCKRFPSKADLAFYLQTELNVGSSAAYKRINGTTPLTVDDIHLLSGSLGISLDQFIMPSYARVTFRSDAMRKLPQSYSQYLQNVINMLLGFKKVEGLSTTSIGTELPLFHYANFPNLYHFKLYYWKQTFWNFGTPEQLFEMKSYELDEDIHKLTKAIGKEYYNIPSTEIWTEDLFTPILKQIAYFLQLRCFEDPNEALVLIEDVKKLKERLYDFCKTGKKKFNSALPVETEIDVYYNELHDGTDGLIFNAGEMTYSFIKYDGPNFIHTQQTEFGKYSNQWIANIINKSSGISAKDQRDRRTFFARVDKKIEEAEKRIKHIIGGM